MTSHAIQTAQEDAETVTCDRCKSAVGAGASVCPECGYSATKELNKTGYLLLVVGLIPAVTGVGLVLSLPVWYFAYRTLQDAQQKTVAYDATEYRPW